MALPSPPNPMPAWSKTLFAPVQNIGQTLEHLFDYWFQLAAGDALEWRRFVVRCEDTVSAVTADDAFFTFDMVNYTGGAIDTSWTTSDYDSVTNQLATALGSYATFMSTNRSFTQLRAYIMKFDPGWAGSSSTEKRAIFADTGPPDYVASLNRPGTAAQHQAHQVSCSVTEIVPRRPNWGRFYLPSPTSVALQASNGRWTTAFVDAVATAFHSCFATLANSELFLVVPTSSSDRVRVEALQNVAALRVDDVPDVIRRRRLKYKTYSKELGI